MTNPSPADVGAKFADLLRQTMLPSEWDALVERNSVETNPGVCHSHDFLDANMIMAEAFESFGLDPLPDSDSPQWDAHAALWNEAWSIAKRDHMKPGEPKPDRFAEIRRLVGKSVRFLKPIGDYPVTPVSEGETGVVIDGGNDFFKLHLTKIHPDLEEWGNCLHLNEWFSDADPENPDFSRLADHLTLTGDNYRLDECLTLASATSNLDHAVLLVAERLGITAEMGQGDVAGIWWSGRDDGWEDMDPARRHALLREYARDAVIFHTEPPED